MTQVERGMETRVKRFLLVCGLAGVVACPAWAQVPPAPRPPAPPPRPERPAPAQPMLAYPAIPMPDYPYPPSNTHQKLVAPAFTPSVQFSPTYPTATKGLLKKPKPAEAKPLPARAGKPSSSPVLTRELHAFEKNSEKYQERLDDILRRHNGNWESLTKHGKDREDCETILKRWAEDEARLEAVYRRYVEGGAASRGDKTGKGSGDTNGGELTTGDVDL